LKYWFSKGNNRSGSCKGDYICILNPDTVVAERYIRKGIGFRQRKKVRDHWVQLLVVVIFLPESKRGVPLLLLLKMVGLYKIFPNQNYLKILFATPRTRSVRQLRYLVGAFMVLKESYIKIMCFDENCLYSDDIDLSYRTTLLGKTNFYYAGLLVIHLKEKVQ
jgi:GT2 family glycosyltransferase